MFNGSGFFSTRSNPNGMSPLRRIKVMQCGMRRNTIIPHNDRSLLPLDTNLNIRRLGNEIIQKPKHRIRFLLLQSHDITRKLLIDKERFFAGDGMDADDGVDVCDGFAADVAACETGVGGLFVARVDGFEAFEEGLELRGETFISLDLGDK
jgi:hypothetical protein